MRAHRRLMPPDPPLQGWPGSEVFIPNRFPAALPVTGLGALSDALVGRQPWDSPLVLKERDAVLGPDWEEHVRKWRTKAAATVINLFQEVKLEDQCAFGKVISWNARMKNTW